MSRPPMFRVVNMLTRDIEIGAVTSKPSYLSDWNFNDETSSFIMNSGIGTSSSTASYSKNKSDNPNDLSQGVGPLVSPLNPYQASIQVQWNSPDSVNSLALGVFVFDAQWHWSMYTSGTP
ncbi:hypothetical protein Pint_11546 [Pistacia integerrima]|uniref:Uncharacterized protein n=1 Tax=Pistacia integerrima TaxID=434235 RepID=A0ACC0XF62_9ROSI|nr:hypothetical protein Pint_11546 [Pistacia integerrima]